MKVLNKLKRTGTIFMASMIVILSISTISYASPQLYFSEEGIGIEVHNPVDPAISVYSFINDPAVSVSGGSLWTTWNTSNNTFRANYKHASKTHRCSATNDSTRITRSAWEPKGITAISPWLDQTLIGNKVWGATK